MVATDVSAPEGAEQAGDGNLGLDLDALTDSLWDELHGSVDRREIRRVLLGVVPNYREARIVTYVPIFVRRDALKILRGRA